MKSWMAIVLVVLLSLAGGYSNSPAAAADGVVRLVFFWSDT
jgi:hypothetical protein